MEKIKTNLVLLSFIAVMVVIILFVLLFKSQTTGYQLRGMMSTGMSSKSCKMVANSYNDSCDADPTKCSGKSAKCDCITFTDGSTDCDIKF